MNFKRKKRRTMPKVIGKQKRVYRTADRMRERRLWRRDNEL